MKTTDIFFSIDVEADGRIPGLSSMLSLGGVAVTIDKRILGSFSRNLHLLPGASPEPSTTEFWDRNPLALQEARRDPVAPEAAMADFVQWVRLLAGGKPPVFVGYPAAFDFAWIDHYCVRFTGDNPFTHRGCLDMRTRAWGHVGGNFSRLSPRMFPEGWLEPEAHTHVALADAREQAGTFVNMERSLRGMPPVGPFTDEGVVA